MKLYEAMKYEGLGMELWGSLLDQVKDLCDLTFCHTVVTTVSYTHLTLPTKA